jgi:hypothetical protein
MLARSALRSATSRRPIRFAGAALGVAAVATLLSSCDRPLPEVSVLSGSTVVRVQPQTYYFDGPSSARVSSGTIRSIKAAGGNSILVDVPREIAGQQWQVSAVTIDAQGKQTALQVDGASSPVVTDTHSARVVVPFATGSYYLKVASANGKAAGIWLIQVDVTA